MSNLDSHLVLIGFMGSGKSTVGKLLACDLSMPFVDLDEYISSKEQMSIQNIFDQKGEKHFRNLETEALSLLLKSQEKFVIATGGGTSCSNENINKIKAYSISFYMKVGRQLLMSRLKNDVQRPLLQNKSSSQLYTYIDNTLRERDYYYKKANYTIMAKNSPEKITKRIISKYKRR